MISVWYTEKTGFPASHGVAGRYLCEYIGINGGYCL